jgi:predicted acyl esterase
VIVPGEELTYRNPLVPNARRFASGHRIRVDLTGEDESKGAPTIMGLTHLEVGGASRNIIRSSSRLLLPIVAGFEASVLAGGPVAHEQPAV